MVPSRQLRLYIFCHYTFFKAFCSSRCYLIFQKFSLQDIQIKRTTQKIDLPCVQFVPSSHFKVCQQPFVCPRLHFATECFLSSISLIRVIADRLRSIPRTIGMNHARNIRHDDSPFFQPDMFIAGTDLHRQGTYQTEYEPAKKYLLQFWFNASFPVLFIA